MKIVNMRTDHIVNPMGYQMDVPTFTWVVEEAVGKKQTAARVRVAADPQMTQILADTGMTAEASSLGTKVDVALAPRTRYYWDVTVQSDAGEEETSEAAWFETGKMDEAWTAKWIGCDESKERHPIFGKTFSLDKEPACARLYICGLGLYHAEINGKAASAEKLTPYCTDYNAWVQYQTYDVSDLLKAGDNAMDVTLGIGWYLGRFGFTSHAGDVGGYYGDRFRLLAELHVFYADGTSEVIATDDSWKVTRSSITFSNIYDGEHRDDTLPATEPEDVVVLVEREDWKEAMAEDAAAAKPLNLTERLSLPVIAHEEFSPLELIDTPAGEKVFDFGQNLAGNFRLRVHEPAGTKIHVQVGEVMQNDCFYRDNLRTALAEYWYTSDGEEHVLEPVFTFYGFRYVKVEGVSNLTKDSMTVLAYYSDVTPVSSFESGDAKLNQLMKNIAWGQKGNFVDVPTDCPQRDERMGWTADTQVFVPTASYLTDSWAFYRKWLHDLALDQAEHGGMVPDVVPAFGQDNCSSVWGDAACIMPWALYLYHGDRTILERQFDSMKAWVDYVRAYDGENHAWRSHFHYGDWLALDNPRGGVDQVKGGTEDGFIADVYYMNSADIVAKTAALLGKDEDAKAYAALTEQIRSEILKEYYTPNGRCAITTMTGYILSLYYNLTTDRERALKSLVNLLKIHNNKFVTGFVGTPLVSRVLSAAGCDKQAYTIIHDERYPGWLYEINLGATTVWERWNSMDENGMVSSTGMNSFNHYAYGAIGEWMWQTMAGISPDPAVPGFKHAILRPVADFATKSMKACYQSAAGVYRTEWEVLSETRVRVKVEVPFDAAATLILPYAKEEEAVRELSAGTFEITYDLTEPLLTHLSTNTPIVELLDDPRAVDVLGVNFPQIFMIPGQYQEMSLRQLSAAFGGYEEGQEGMMEKLDELLGAL